MTQESFYDTRKLAPAPNRNVQWERVATEQCCYTSRLRVPGGWLYMVWGERPDYATAAAIAVCYVPDPLADLVPVGDERQQR